MVEKTGDSQLVKEGRVDINFLFHSNCLISQCCFYYQKVKITYICFSSKNVLNSCTVSAAF